jgi:ABC-type cobalamin transport system ATPase subunit
MYVNTVYEGRLRRFQGIVDAEMENHRRLGWIRAVFFAMGLVSFLLADVGPMAWRGPAAVLTGLILVIFFLLVVRHRRVKQRRARAETMADINRMGIARTQRNWTELPPGPIPDPGRDHPYVLDLDVTGQGSLAQLLSTANLPPGLNCLREWLFSAGPRAEVLSRQQAVAELAQDLELRQALEAAGRMTAPPEADSLEAFLTWAESETWLSGRRWILLVARILPLFSAGLLFLFISGRMATPWFLLTLGAGLGFGYWFKPRLHPIMEVASGGEERFGRYASALELLLQSDVTAPLLRDLKSSVQTSPVGAVRELRYLAAIVGWADARYSPLAHFPLQAFLVWDVHVLSRLEKWQTRCGPHVREWLSALGTFEALSALATLKADHPDWCFPTLTDNGSDLTVRAEGMGHPLLPPDRRVDNDVVVGPPGTFLFVTGSNMSGKSTLLRAIGTNCVLALAGGPVCASSMTLPPLRVHTSMRTSDSLSEGVSQYMAELNRIRQVVEDARADGLSPVLYLLDEPLQGTNEAERRVAVQTILGHLLRSGAIGAVATHDLHLDDTPALEEGACAVHMAGSVEEHPDGPVVAFDYLVREGRATSTNDLALLRAGGLGGEPTMQKDERRDGKRNHR